MLRANPVLCDSLDSWDGRRFLVEESPGLSVLSLWILGTVAGMPPSTIPTVGNRPGCADGHFSTASRQPSRLSSDSRAGEERATRAARRDGSTSGPSPYASQAGEIPSACASASAVAMLGMVPRSMFPTDVWLTSASRASANTDSPRALRTVRSRAPALFARSVFESGQSVSMPYARNAGEIPSAKATFSTVSSRGIRSPRSRLATSSRSAAADLVVSPKRVCPLALRAFFSRAGKRICSGFLRPRTTSLGSTSVSSASNWIYLRRKMRIVLQSLRTKGTKRQRGKLALKIKQDPTGKPAESLARVGWKAAKQRSDANGGSMPCHVRSSTISRRRSSLFPSSPPPVAAGLDIAKPGERAAQDLLRRFSSGRWPTWRPLAMRRGDSSLLVAVEWHPRSLRTPRSYSVVAVALDATALRWHDFPSAKAAQRACKLATAHLAPDADAARGHA